MGGERGRARPGREAAAGIDWEHFIDWFGPHLGLGIGGPQTHPLKATQAVGRGVETEGVRGGSISIDAEFHTSKVRSLVSRGLQDERVTQGEGTNEGHPSLRATPVRGLLRNFECIEDLQRQADWLCLPAHRKS